MTWIWWSLAWRATPTIVGRICTLCRRCSASRVNWCKDSLDSFFFNLNFAVYSSNKKEEVASLCAIVQFSIEENLFHIEIWMDNHCKRRSQITSSTNMFVELWQLLSFGLSLAFLPLFFICWVLLAFLFSTGRFSCPLNLSTKPVMSRQKGEALSSCWCAGTLTCVR